MSVLMHAKKKCFTKERAYSPRRMRDALAWRILLTMTVCAPSLLAQASDTVPPQLVGIELSPQAIDVSSGAQTVTVTLHVTDNLSGADFAGNFFPRVSGVYFVSPSGKQTRSLDYFNYQTRFALISGTPLDGFWQGQVSFPQFSEGGVWTISRISLLDNVGNQATLDTPTLTAAGFPTNLTVTSIADTTPPQLAGISFSRGSVDVSNSAQTIDITLTLTDNLSGLNFQCTNNCLTIIYLSSPSGQQHQWSNNYNFAQISGTALNGEWKTTITIPQYAEPGIWTVSWVQARDNANNMIFWNTAQLQNLGLPTSFGVVDSQPDTTPPTLTALSFNPTFVDSSLGPQTISLTVGANDNLSGVDYVAGYASPHFNTCTVTFTSPSGQQEDGAYCYVTPFTLIDGTALEGVWKTSFVVPQFSEQGAWQITSLYIKDNAGNYFAPSTAQLQALGFPTTLNITQSEGGGGGGSSHAAVFFGSAGTTTNPTAFVAEPINSATGNYFASHVDLSMHGRGISFRFSRQYNSLDGYSGPLGVGWTHTYNLLLNEDSTNGDVTIKQADGSTISFMPSGKGQYTPITAGLFDTLGKNADGSFTLTRKSQVKLNFSAAGRLVSVSDRNNNTQNLSYDTNGNLVSLTDTSGRVFAFAYDAENRLTSLSDPSGRTVRYSYDSAGNLVSFQDALGGTTRYTYDANHRLVSGTDARGVVYVQNTFDSNGRVTVQKNGRGVAAQFAYDSPSPGTTTITDGNGNTIQHVYDSSLRLIKVINGVGSVTGFSYDANNDRTSITNANGGTTTLTYDARGNVGSVKNALGNAALFAYDALNDVTTVTDPAGHVTTIAYDPKGNPASVENALGEMTQYAHDTFGELLSRTDALGNQTQFSWDQFGNLIQIRDGAGRKHTFAYDSIGRMTSSTDGLGHSRKMQYDALSRITKRTDAIGNTTQYFYDGVGDLIKITDANGNSTSYIYDAVENLIAVKDALNQTTAYSYDGNNNRISFRNARGKITRYAYDAANRRVKAADPLVRSKVYEYDAVGNVVAATDGKGNTNHFAYDALNRLLNTAYADGSSVSYSYDIDGNRVSMTDRHGVTSYLYDALNRLVSVSRFDGKVVGYAYNAAGRRSSLVYPDGRTVEYEYDGSNRLTGVIDWSRCETVYSYDDAGNLVAVMLPNGVRSARQYDAANRLLSITNADRFGVLSSFAYTLDGVGNRLQVASSEGISRYGYDPLDRLISWTARSGRMTKYTYDEVGNRTSLQSPRGITEYTYDDADELLTAGPIAADASSPLFYDHVAASFTYDGNGSRITKEVYGKMTSYGWDSANRLVSVAGPDGSVTYDYDGDGNRIAQQSGDMMYSYVNDVARLPIVIEEEGSKGHIDYLYGYALVGGFGSRTTNYVDSDGIGSIANLSNSAGAPTVTYSYDPWGNVLRPIAPLEFKNEYKFAGQGLDSADGLYYMRARYYDPGVGRFISRDPFVGYPLSPVSRNRYVYAQNNPQRFTDPSGLSSEPAGGADLTELFSAAPSSATLPISYGISISASGPAISYPPAPVSVNVAADTQSGYPALNANPFGASTSASQSSSYGFAGLFNDLTPSLDSQAPPAFPNPVQTVSDDPFASQIGGPNATISEGGQQWNETFGGNVSQPGGGSEGCEDPGERCMNGVSSPDAQENPNPTDMMPENFSSSAP